MVYWLKTKTDIDADGYTYDANSFPLDTNAITIDLDNPKRKYNVKKIIGNGASISGGDYYADRIIAFSKIFKYDGVSTTGAFNAVRQAFISKYMISSDEIYLIRDYNGTLQYIRVYPILGGEKYKKFVASEDFDIKMYCDIPFFQNVTLTETALFDKTTRFFDKTFTNLGIASPIIFEGTFDATDTEIKIGVYDNYGVRVVRDFVATDTIKIDSGDLRVWINGVERFNLVIEGTPFNILSGSSTVRIECVSNLSDCKISYRERNL